MRLGLVVGNGVNRLGLAETRFQAAYCADDGRPK